ncbi:MAG: hypothetical protein HYY55_04040 [Candidatus Niyogibacteria bacterium]|nr:MAG: hypothetical protein HYY55_04040 [Candidatus Niyogibacteria bacterium]
MNAETLGVDIGGVIIDRVNDGTDTSFFTDNYLRTTAVPGVFDALRQLVEKRFGDKVFLVSKCGQRVQNKTLQWLDHHRFYDLTGIGRERVRFCRERHEKAGICEELGVTHFVDDRLEVLGNLATVSTLYLFQPRPDEVWRYARFLSRVKQVNSWQEILNGELP